MQPGSKAALALTCLFVLAFPASAHASSTPTRDVLMTANSSDGTVTLIDAHSFRVLGKLSAIPDGNTPRDPAQAAVYPTLVQRQGVNYAQDMALSPDGEVLYVSRGYLGDVAAISLRTGKILWRLQVNSLRADHVALSPDGRLLFVSALTSNEVQVIDTATHAFVGSFLTGDWPHVLGFSPDGKYVYNGSLGNQLAPSGLDGRKQLTVADARTFNVVRTFDFNAGVRPFVITPDGNTMFMQLSYFNGFIEFDLQTGRTLATVNLPLSRQAQQMAPKDYPNQAAHHGIALSPDGHHVCDAGTISNYVALVSRPALTVAAIIPVGADPGWAISSLDGRYCVVTSRGANANSLSVISYATRTEVARIRVGLHPQFVLEARTPEAVLRAGGFLAPSAPTGRPVARGAPGCGRRLTLTVGQSHGRVTRVEVMSTARASCSAGAGESRASRSCRPCARTSGFASWPSPWGTGA
jgi:DNA-binding beta-propeller fold protein YncE